MISGIQSLSTTHEQLIIGWTGDIETCIPGERLLTNSISQEDKDLLEDGLATYTPREADPDDDKKTRYVPVWLDDKVAHGHYDGYCKTSEFIVSGIWRRVKPL
jgi:trehalose 6-phosphate synthase/phosphatase